MKFILSTMTNSVGYTFYRIPDAPNSPAIVEKKVTIYGGAGLPSHRSGFGERTDDAVNGSPLWTAAGIITPVKDEDAARLETHYLFKKHLDKGHVRILNEDLRENYKKLKQVAGGMEKDGFALLTPSTHKQRIKVKMPAELEQESGFRL